MKLITRLTTTYPIILALASVTLFAACSDNGSDADDQLNIVETAQSSDDFTVLAQAIGDAGLAGTLSSSGPFTVFAPTDDAFGKLPQGTLESLTQEQLVSILTYHVLSGTIRSTDLVAEQAPATVQGGSVYVEATDGVTVNNSATVIQPDIEATNGVIHAIDEVIFPDAFLDVTGIVGKRYNLETLAGAIGDAGLASTLQEVTENGYTVFAPLNSAFDAITVPTSQQELADILTYHVIPAKVLSSDLQPSQTVTTVNGAELTIEVSNGTVTINGNSVVTTADLEGTNGVVHVIDAVLIP